MNENRPRAVRELTLNTKLPSWLALKTHSNELSGLHLRTLFEQDHQRHQQHSINTENLFVDYSKHRITQQTISLLLRLVEETGVCDKRDALFQGKEINYTEKRAVLHSALRDPSNEPLIVDGENIRTAIANEIDKMTHLCERLHNKEWLGYSRQPIQDIAVIGIGGSYLGPKLACEALHHLSKKTLNIHFVSNVDGHAIDETLSSVNPETTLVVVISKTFTTQETLLNANTAADWLRKHSGTDEAIQQQFIAISSNTERVKAFGIADAHTLTMWDWVGGRYSLWSAVGFPIMLSAGPEQFKQLLAGAHTMDAHFQQTPADQNIPIILACLGIWNINFLNLANHAVLPYDERLRSLPMFLQQLDMESNGKSTTHAGLSVDYATGPVLFGESGTNGQHAFYQLLHQGTTEVPCDFIASIQPNHPHTDLHQALLANMVAQAQAMMMGRPVEETQQRLLDKGHSQQESNELAQSMSFSGNRPSTTILLDELNANTLGQLLALYEHKVFVQGVIWDINSFDQMGVELGKTLTNKLLPTFTNKQIPAGLDSSTAQLLQHIIKNT